MIKPHLPERFRESIDLYLERGILPGSFLLAVLENKLKEALGAADWMSVHELPGIVSWLYNNVPFNVWGSEERVTLHHLAMKDKARKERDRQVSGVGSE